MRRRKLASIFAKLRRILDPAVDRALAAALPTADAASLERVVALLLERGHPDGLAGLVSGFHRLPAGVQGAVVARAADLFRVLREAAMEPEVQSQLNAVQIIREARATRLAYLLADRLRHGEEAVRGHAAAGLLELAQRAEATAEGGAEIDAEAAGFLVSAVEEAVAAYSAHRQSAVLLAVLWLWPRPTPQVTLHLNNPHHAAVSGLELLLRRAEQPIVRRRLLLALGLPELAPAALDALRHAGLAGGLGEAVEPFHVLTLSAVRQSLAKVKAVEGLLPDEEQLDAMSVEGRRGLPALIVALPESRESKVQRLIRVGQTADATTRLFVLRRLLAMAQAGRDAVVDDAIAGFCGDEDEGLARMALWHLIRGGYQGLAKVLAQLVSSPHEELRAIASRRLAPVAFSRLWLGWPKLDEARRLSAGRAIIKLDPTFHRSLGDKLASSDRDARLRALSIITTLNQGEFFTGALIRLAQVRDGHVASAGVRALGSATGEEAEAALRRSLGHPDGRVRANAIEALAAHRRAEDAEQLAQLAEDAEGRPRANAIAALLELNPAEAMEALRRMLADARPGHRHSALWLVEKAGLVEVVHEVAEHSISDPDPAVRRRAERGIGLLLERMSAGSSADSGEVVAGVMEVT